MPRPRSEKGLRQLTTTVPRIEMGELRRATRRTGMCQITWSDGLRRERYHALVNAAEDHVEIRSGFDAPDEEQTEVQISARDAGSGERRTFICPACVSSCRTIYYHYARWACRKCLRLGYPIQYLQPVTLWLDELNEIKAAVAGGRPRYMREAKYHDRLARIEQLEGLLQAVQPKNPKSTFARSLFAVYSEVQPDSGGLC